MGETLRRLVSSLLLRRVAGKAHQYLSPLQTVVATPGGIEATAHAITDLIQQHGASADIALLQIDLANAFNLINMHAILHEIHTHLPELLRWTVYCYGLEVRPHLWHATRTSAAFAGSNKGIPSASYTSRWQSIPSSNISTASSHRNTRKILTRQRSPAFTLTERCVRNLYRRNAYMAKCN